MNKSWGYKPFRKLTVDEFHDIIQLREQVFIVEQDCPYLDVDGKDKEAIHVVGVIDDRVVATARILDAGVSYKEVSIGRVVVSPDFRGVKLGIQLMEYTMKAIEELFGKVPIRISAQVYLKRYYEGFEFRQIGEPYLEDNIPHIQMLYNPK